MTASVTRLLAPAVLTLQLCGCSGNKDHPNPVSGHYEFRDAADPPSDFPFPEVLEANMSSEACLADIERWSPDQRKVVAHDPVPLGAGFDLHDSGVDAYGRSAFSLTLETERIPIHLDCMTNASADFLCWSEEHNDDRRFADPSGLPDDLSHRAPGVRSRPPLTPINQPLRSYYWHYIYGWILDPAERDVLFGVLMTATNHDDYWPCPDRTVWTAEWVGEAE